MCAVILYGRALERPDVVKIQSHLWMVVLAIFV